MSIVAGFMGYAALLPGKDAGHGKKGMPTQIQCFYYFFRPKNPVFLMSYFHLCPANGVFSIYCCIEGSYRY